MVKELSIKLIDKPVYYSEIMSKDIYAEARIWSGKRGTTEGTILGFFEHKKKEILKSYPNAEFNFFLVDVRSFETKDIMNGDDDIAYYMIRYVTEYIKK